MKNFSGLLSFFNVRRKRSELLSFWLTNSLFRYIQCMSGSRLNLRWTTSRQFQEMWSFQWWSADRGFKPKAGKWWTKGGVGSRHQQTQKKLYCVSLRLHSLRWILQSRKKSDKSDILLYVKGFSVKLLLFDKNLCFFYQSYTWRVTSYKKVHFFNEKESILLKIKFQ